jgi:hypothetical protein
MSTEIERVVETIGPEVTLTEEVPMVRQERWEELRRLWQQERVPIAELARRFELDARPSVGVCATRRGDRTSGRRRRRRCSRRMPSICGPGPRRFGTPSRSCSRSSASGATEAATRW